MIKIKTFDKLVTDCFNFTQDFYLCELQGAMKQQAGTNPPASQVSNQPAAEKSATPQPEQQNQAEDKQQAPVTNSPQQVCLKLNKSNFIQRIHSYQRFQQSVN